MYEKHAFLPKNGLFPVMSYHSSCSLYSSLLLDYDNLLLDYNNLLLDYNNPIIIYYYYNPRININPSCPVLRNLSIRKNA